MMTVRQTSQWVGYYWNEDKKEQIIGKLWDKTALIEGLKYKVNEVGESIVGGIKSPDKQRKSQPTWFDKNCQNLRLIKYKTLNILGLSNNEEHLEKYKCLKR